MYKGRILEPVGSGGIHGLLGSVGTKLLDVVLGNLGRCSCRLYGGVGMDGHASDRDAECAGASIRPASSSSSGSYGVSGSGIPRSEG